MDDDRAIALAGYGQQKREPQPLSTYIHSFSANRGLMSPLNAFSILAYTLGKSWQRVVKSFLPLLTVARTIQAATGCRI